MAEYRADHVGSFLRPPELLEARTAHAEGRIGDAELRAAEDRAILTILEVQRRIGVDVYSDGEYRRGMWLTGLPAAVEGFGPGAMLNIRNWRGRPLPYVPGQTGARHAAAAGQNPPAVIIGKLVPKRRITGVESGFLRQHAPGAPLAAPLRVYVRYSYSSQRTTSRTPSSSHSSKRRKKGAEPTTESHRIVFPLLPGIDLVPLPEGASYPGFIFARAKSPERVEAALREAHRRLQFVVMAPRKAGEAVQPWCRLERAVMHPGECGGNALTSPACRARDPSNLLLPAVFLNSASTSQRQGGRGAGRPGQGPATAFGSVHRRRPRLSPCSHGSPRGDSERGFPMYPHARQRENNACMICSRLKW